MSSETDFRKSMCCSQKFSEGTCFLADYNRSLQTMDFEVRDAEVIALPVHNITARSITFCNSLMLPSHLCIINNLSTSLLNEMGAFPILVEKRFKKCLLKWEGNIRELQNVIERAVVYQMRLIFLKYPIYPFR